MGSVSIYSKITSRRTIRKYLQKAVPEKVLMKCVDAARLSPSSANLQPLKYIIINEEKLLKKVFSTLSWAGYLPDYQPNEEEMPRAYIIILVDKKINQSPNHDVGIAAMSISMVAYDEGLGSCILESVDREKLRENLELPSNPAVALVVAVGYSAEKPVVATVRAGDVKYHLDDKGVLHVPKRKLKDIAIWNTHQNR